MDFSLIWPHLICSRTLLNVGLCAVLIFTLLKMIRLIRSMVRWLYSVLGHRSQQFNNQSGQKASDESIVSQAPELESHNSEHVNSSCHSHPSVEVTQRNRCSTLFEGYSATSESWVQLQNEADDLIACIKEKLKEKLPSLVTLNDTEVISLVDIVSGSILEIRKGHLRPEKNGLNLQVNHDEDNSQKEISTGVDQSKKPRVIGPAKSSTISSATSNNANKSQKEIIRLESLCESRTKELIQTKILLKDAATGFDAMTILVNYCCNELNAFECPFLAQRLEKIKGKLAEYLNQINELNNEKERLNQCLATALQEKEESSRQVQETLTLANQEREDHMRITHEMDDTHNASLTAQRDELTKKHEEALQKYIQYYDKQLDLMKHAHERQVSEMKNENKLEINGLKIAHLEEIQGLRNKHDSQMEDLHQQHRNKLEDITLRFESIKLTLSDKVESLRGECEELRHRARNSEEALQRDADVKVQMALAPYMSLPKEIESLKTVVEMRNEEIQKLRNKNTDQEKILEELPIAKEKIISLQQKVENLEAIINIKSDHEKQLHEHCQILMRKYDRASRANKRLSMDYEQVMWRMSQSSEFGSCESLTHRQLSKSPPPRSDHGSPEGRHRNISPNIAGDVVMRKKRNSHSVGDGDRKLRSRSATFVVEKDDNSDIHSPSSSPQPKLKRWRKKIVGDDKLLSVEGRAERMCRSAGSEIFSDFSQKQNKPESDDSNILADGTDNMMSSVEMADSYSRSISGVSDSGVYDSMSRSDMLNSSVISTDSEWVVSANSSLILDNSAEDDNALQSGDYSSLNEMYLAQTPGARSFIKASNTVVFCPASKEATGEDCLESGPLDNVFDDILSMDSSICSLDNLDINGSDKPTS